MVDSNDRERITEAREECELDKITCGGFEPTFPLVQRMLSEDELREALLLVFANKQVRRDGVSWRQLKAAFYRICLMR